MGVTAVGAEPAERINGLDHLKVMLVTVVIVGHAVLAWTVPGGWTISATPLGQPFRSLALLAFGVGSLFAMANFFFLAGLFAVGSRARRGTRRYLGERMLRLGLPMLIYWLVLSPVVESANPRNAGFAGDLPSFLVAIWWPPNLGASWFLAALLVLTIIYVALQRLGSGPRLRPSTLLLGSAVLITVSSYLVRLLFPLGMEIYGFHLAQSPSWLIMFALGVLLAHGGGLTAVPRQVVRRWTFAGAGAAVLACVALVWTGGLEGFAGGVGPASLAAAAIEGCVAVGISLGLTDGAARRWNRQGRLLAAASRGAFGAYLLHQPILVWAAVALDATTLRTEVTLGLAVVVGVGGAFLAGTQLVRVRPLSRILAQTRSSRSGFVARDLPDQERQSGRETGGAEQEGHVEGPRHVADQGQRGEAGGDQGPGQPEIETMRGIGQGSECGGEESQLQ